MNNCADCGALYKETWRKQGYYGCLNCWDLAIQKDYPNLFWHDENPFIALFKQCECGSEAVKSSIHSSYCPKFVTESKTSTEDPKDTEYKD